MENIKAPHVTLLPGNQPNVGLLVFEPLLPGYGTTVGNALRRMLLSSLTGAAITGVKIHGASHEFTTIPKVKEDVLEVILNLKKLRLKVFSDEPVTLKLKVKGNKEVTAGDIEANSDVEIVNKDLHIATLWSRDAELEMDLIAEKGKGFVPTETREKQRRDIGTIAIDALFSPVRRVAVKVEGARVGQMTNFDKVTLEIETDGTITPEEAVSQSAKTLIAHFESFAALSSLKPEGNSEDGSAEPVSGDGTSEEGAPKKKRVSKKKAE